MFEDIRVPEGYQLEYLAQTGSTNDDAMAKGPGWIVVAGCQTAGRGRMGRAVPAEEGGLYLSMSLHPEGSFRDAYYGLRAAAAVCAQKALGEGTKIVWPCDIVKGDETLASILCEAQGENLVIGFWVLPMPEGPSPETMLQSILTDLAAYVADWPGNIEKVMQDYCDRCLTLMHFVDVTYRGMPLYGFAFAVDRVGGLMVMTQESLTVVTVYSGDAPLAEDPPESPEVPIQPHV